MTLRRPHEATRRVQAKSLTTHIGKKLQEVPQVFDDFWDSVFFASRLLQEGLGGAKEHLLEPQDGLGKGFRIRASVSCWTRVGRLGAQMLVVLSLSSVLYV